MAMKIWSPMLITLTIQKWRLTNLAQLDKSKLHLLLRKSLYRWCMPKISAFVDLVYESTTGSHLDAVFFYAVIRLYSLTVAKD